MEWNIFIIQAHIAMLSNTGWPSGPLSAIILPENIGGARAVEKPGLRARAKKKRKAASAARTVMVAPI
jgi:hypothetical protein